jgi:hypothetical protein
MKKKVYFPYSFYLSLLKQCLLIHLISRDAVSDRGVSSLQFIIGSSVVVPVVVPVVMVPVVIFVPVVVFVVVAAEVVVNVRRTVPVVMRNVHVVMRIVVRLFI